MKISNLKEARESVVGLQRREHIPKNIPKTILECIVEPGLGVLKVARCLNTVSLTTKFEGCPLDRGKFIPSKQNHDYASGPVRTDSPVSTRNIWRQRFVEDANELLLEWMEW